MGARRVTRALAATAAVWLAVAGPAGAAGDPDRSAAARTAIARAYAGYVHALALGHGRSVCNRLTASGRAELMGAAGLWSPWRGTCAEAVTRLRGVARPPATLHDVRIFGTLASARLATDDYQFFARAGRRWKVAATAATNPLLPPAPRRAKAKPQFLGVDWKRVQRWGEDAWRWDWLAAAVGGAFLLLTLLLAIRGRRYRRKVLSLERSLEELTARAQRALATSRAAPSAPTDADALREDLAALMRVNKELVARLDAAQSRSEGMTRRLLDELARAGHDTEQASRLEQRLARSESARAEAQAEIQALQDHVRRLRERVNVPD